MPQLTRMQAMKIMCSECMCWYADGKVDCVTPTCPLYRWMPYRKLEPLEPETPPKQQTKRAQGSTKTRRKQA